MSLVFARGAPREIRVFVDSNFLHVTCLSVETRTEGDAGMIRLNFAFPRFCIMLSVRFTDTEVKPRVYH